MLKLESNQASATIMHRAYRLEMKIGSGEMNWWVDGGIEASKTIPYDFDGHRERGIPKIYTSRNEFMIYIIKYRRPMLRCNVILKYHNPHVTTQRPKYRQFGRQVEVPCPNPASLKPISFSGAKPAVR